MQGIAKEFIYRWGNPDHFMHSCINFARNRWCILKRVLRYDHKTAGFHLCFEYLIATTLTPNGIVLLSDTYFSHRRPKGYWIGCEENTIIWIWYQLEYIFILTINNMMLYLFVCLSIRLWFNHEKNTKPISIKCCKIIAHIPGSDIGLFLSLYLFLFKNGGPFSDDTLSQIGIFS